MKKIGNQEIKIVGNVDKFLWVAKYKGFLVEKIVDIVDGTFGWTV